MTSTTLLLVTGGALYVGYSVAKVSAIYSGIKIYKRRRRKHRTAIWLRAQPERDAPS